MHMYVNIWPQLFVWVVAKARFFLLSIFNNLKFYTLFGVATFFVWLEFPLVNYAFRLPLFVTEMLIFAIAAVFLRPLPEQQKKNQNKKTKKNDFAFFYIVLTPLFTFNAAHSFACWQCHMQHNFTHIHTHIKRRVLHLMFITAAPFSLSFSYFSCTRHSRRTVCANFCVRVYVCVFSLSHFLFVLQSLYVNFVAN